METSLQHPLTKNLGQFSDSDTVNTVLQQIGAEKNWSAEDVNGDLEILHKNRIVNVSDLRVLSEESWTQIQLLPLVKDLLKLAISDPDDEEEESDKKKKKDKKNKKGEGKKKKEEKNKGFVSPSPLGTPVVPTIIRPPSGFEETDDDGNVSHDDGNVSHDHLTVHNTILNGNSSCGSSAEEDEEEEVMSPSGTVRRKSVSFSNETCIGVAASEKKKDKEDKKKNKDKKKKKNDKDDK